MTCLALTIIAALFFQAALIFEWRQRIDMSCGFLLHFQSTLNLEWRQRVGCHVASVSMQHLFSDQDSGEVRLHITCLALTSIAAQFFQAALIFEWRQRIDCHVASASMQHLLQ